MTTSFSRFDSRLQLITALFLLFFLLICCRALYLGGIAGKKYCAIGESISKKQGIIPARRGSIRDKNGIILAWSERNFQLHSQLRSGESFSALQIRRLRSALPGRNIPEKPDTGTALCFQLNAKEILSLEPLIKSGIPVKIHSVSRRLIINSAAVRNAVGSVKNKRGVSGWEKHFDSTLRGKDGSYTVILDRRRNWIPSSWQVLTPPEHGKDVNLSQSLRQIESRGEQMI